ncbi:replicative DNA helicase [Plectonema radiosum NIES-515]|uniref:Replicative DNA helicase n=1 Tax=Plectonema radiosum NIES-515 TaxID=2986073 RepID=A0ABT3B5F2_9CYAN|nr:replicative DNA helicase [Plectonema radiosum]MCV3216612.1 replicative DNA helicase [Plectonema radiosum NIES-515]
MSLKYHEYINSQEWQEVRKLALQRSGDKCQICGSKNSLDVHHNSYDNLGNERENLEDLVVLCSEHHQLYHDALAEVERLADQRLEERLLGGLLQQTPALVRGLSNLPADIFTSSLRKEVFNYLCSRSAEEKAIDSTIVASYLANRKLLEAEEAERLLNNWVSCCSNPENSEAYAQVLHDLYLRRQIQQLPAVITRLNRDNQRSVIELIDVIQAVVQIIANKSNTTQLVHIADILSQTFQNIEERYQGITLPGIPCGFYDLDAMTIGFQRSDLIIVAGRPSMGKSSLCLGIAYNIANIYKLPVCFFSLEMSKEQVVERLLSAEAGIQSRYLRSGRISPSQWEPLSSAIGKLSDVPIYIDDRPNLNVSEIRSKARQVMLEHQGILGLIVIDYLQLLAGDNDENRARELAKITRSLKGLAKELNVPVIVLSQLNRSVESRTNKRPMMSDLKESGSIEEDADLVIMLYRDEYYTQDTPERGIAEVILAKHRNGPTGTIKLLFDPQFATFKNLARPN